jgi:DNA-directed RNA polymerase subunit omega
MARITIEDCMEKVPNRFHLVQMASIRAKQLKKGARPLLSSEENKQVVMALREIAAGLVKPGDAEADKSAETEEVPVAPVGVADVAASQAVETTAAVDTLESVESESTSTPTVES